MKVQLVSEDDGIAVYPDKGGIQWTNGVIVYDLPQGMYEEYLQARDAWQDIQIALSTRYWKVKNAR